MDNIKCANCGNDGFRMHTRIVGMPSTTPVDIDAITELEKYLACSKCHTPFTKEPVIINESITLTFEIKKP